MDIADRLGKGRQKVVLDRPFGQFNRPGSHGITRERLRDPVGIRRWPQERGRDPCRTPMQWTGGPGAGFTDPATESWLPIGDAEACNVEAQERDPDSVLHLVRNLVRLRYSTPLGIGPYRTELRERGLWVWHRGDLRIAANLSAERREVALPGRRVLIGSAPGRSGERTGPRTVLEPWEALVLAP